MWGVGFIQTVSGSGVEFSPGLDKVLTELLLLCLPHAVCILSGLEGLGVGAVHSPYMPPTLPIYTLI